MSSIRARKDGRLFFDFYYRGERCRELSALTDTPANRRKMERALAIIDAEIANHTFDYGRTFPASKKATRFANPVTTPAAPPLMVPVATEQSLALPSFTRFVDTWKQDKQVEWRIAYRESVDSILNTHLLPAFGDLMLDEIDRAAVMELRSAIAGARAEDALGAKRTRPLAPATVNRIIGILRMILEEAALRFGIVNPCMGIKRLKLQRKDIEPFTLQEMNRILQCVRKDYRPYLTFRFLTGVRSGEAHGLKWKYVDFQRNQILVRETYQAGRTEYTKTDGSQREIQMSALVREALMTMRPDGNVEDSTQYGDRYVFSTRAGTPIDNANFNDRVWKPLLRHLGLPYRRPYEMRHTCATLWLAAGESPEWIARQLGHTTTEMLFRTYSRYVPNLVRRDGVAFDTMVAGIIHGGVQAEPHERDSAIDANQAPSRAKPKEPQP